MSSGNELKALVRARIRQARLEMGWTQKEMATRLGLSSNVSVARYESGEREVDLDTLARLAALTGRSASWFLEEGNPLGQVQAVLERVRAAEVALQQARTELEGALAADSAPPEAEPWHHLRPEAVEVWLGARVAALEGRPLRREDLSQEMIDEVARRLWEGRARSSRRRRPGD